MAEWSIAGTYLETCNCDPGCGCNFRGLPSSPEGNCEAFLGWAIEKGERDGVDLAGARVVWALWWPGPIHDKGGRGHAYVDCETDDQYGALAAMWRGEDGYGLFEIFNSTFDEPSSVDRATVAMTLDGKRSRFSVEDVGESIITPLTNPVTGDENNVRIVKDAGFIWRDGDIAQGERMRFALGDKQIDLVGRHAVVSRFGYSNVSGFHDA